MEQDTVQESQQPQELWSFKQVMQYLGYSAPTVRKHIKEGRLPMFQLQRPNGRWFGYRKDFENLGKQ